MPYQFQPSWRVSSLFIPLILVFVSSGIWELNHTNDKQAIQFLIDQRSDLEPLSLNMPFSEFAPYQIVQATGYYRAKDSILLDNILYREQPGYYLITPFEIMASRAVILVNRGWLPKGETSTELPSFKTPKGLITLEGHLSHPQLKPASMAQITDPLSSTPPLWHFMDNTFFSQINGYTVLPLMLNLNADGQTSTFHSTRVPLEETETALIQDWPMEDAQPGWLHHYLNPWLALALLCLLVYLMISFKKVNKPRSN